MEGLSKRAIKRQQRMERSKEQRKIKKVARKEAKQQQNSEKNGGKAEVNLEPLPHEQPNAFRAERKANVIESFAKAKSAVTIVIDAAFEEYMTDSEKKSMVQQIAYGYASNKEASIPVNLEICGCGEFIGEKLSRMGSANWASWGVNITKAPIEKVFMKEKMVYLSADSPNVIEKLDPSKAYIIGGIVDRNRHKGLCAGKAESLGIETAKFPLDVFFSKVGFSRVLTTNHCIDILLEFLCSEDWMQACKRGVPVRKLKQRKRKKVRDDEAISDEEVVCENEDEDEPELEGKVEASVADEGLDEPKVDSGPKVQHNVLVFGSCTNLGKAIAQELLKQKWNVILAGHEVETLRESMTKMKADALELGELSYVLVDCSKNGDAARLKDVLSKRCNQQLDAVVFDESQRGFDLDFSSKATFIREMHRVWASSKRPSPKLLLIHDAGPPKLAEWTAALQNRYPGLVQVYAPNLAYQEDILTWITATSSAAAVPVRVDIGSAPVAEKS